MEKLKILVVLLYCLSAKLNVNAMDCEQKEDATECSHVILEKQNSLQIENYSKNLRLIYTDGSIGKTTLHDVPKITTLSISFGSIKRIYPESFSSVRNLSNLTFEFLELPKLETAWLKGLHNLKVLTFNMIFYLNYEDNVFGQLISLTELNIMNCGIKFLSGGDLAGLPISVLNLSFNEITSVDTDKLRNNLTYLKKLNLSRNNITCHRFETVQEELRITNVLVIMDDCPEKKPPIPENFDDRFSYKKINGTVYVSKKELED